MQQKLSTGVNSVRPNVTLLMQPPESASRHKAILTIAKKNNISYAEAQFRQATRIAQSQARKR
jgi:hypothetical protein